jgi:D-serine deaminase-like pyridoxal phosphate-dependent protein
VPNHACVVSNMVDSVHIVGSGGSAAVWPVVARGKII